MRAHGVSDDDIDTLNRTGSWDVTGKWDKFWGLVPEKCRVLAKHQYALYQRLESYAIGVGARSTTSTALLVVTRFARSSR